MVGFQLEVRRNRTRRRRLRSLRGAFFWNRIVAASMPWVAFGEALRAHRCAANHSVRTNGLSGVFGAARKKSAALSEHRTNAVLIRFYQAKRDRASRVGALRLGARTVAVHAFTCLDGVCGVCTGTTLLGLLATFAPRDVANLETSRSSAPVHSAITAGTSLGFIAVLKRTTYCISGNTA